MSVKPNYGSFAVCQGAKIIVAVSFTLFAVRVAFCAVYFKSIFPGTPNRATVHSGRCGHATPSEHAVSSGGRSEESAATGAGTYSMYSFILL